MQSYYRLMLGKRSAFAAECFEGGFIGVDFQIDEDLSRKFPDDWRSFNKAYVPVFLAGHPAIEQWAAAREAQTGQTTLSAEQLSVLQRAVVETVQVFAKHLERDRELWELVASHFTPESLGVDALGRAEIFAAAL